MGAPYSESVRASAIKYYEEGTHTQEEVSELLGMHVSTFKRFYKHYRETGEIAKAKKGTGRPKLIDEAGYAQIKQYVAEDPSITLEEIQARYEEDFQVPLSLATICRALQSLSLNRKKVSHYAQEQEREDVKKKRENYRQACTGIMAKNLVFIDESGINVKHALPYARAFQGERVKLPMPLVRGKTYSIIGAVTCEKVIASLYGEWATNAEIFDHFVEYHLCPALKPEHIVVLDNVSFHHNEHIRKKIENTGAKVMYLPPYSPDFSPIENMWAKLKHYLRKFAARTDEQLQEAMKKAFHLIQSSDLTGWYRHCGYL